MIPRSCYDVVALSGNERRHRLRRRLIVDNDTGSRTSDNCRNNNTPSRKNLQLILSRGCVVLLCTISVMATNLLPPPDQCTTIVVHGYTTQSSNRLRQHQQPSTISHHHSILQRLHYRQGRRNDGLTYRERSTRRFVLTTPEAIIEQASTTKLLDDLIDESVRTSARRPLMMQFDPSSGWIWKRWKGTVFSETWDACVYRMIYACVVFLLCKSFPQTKELLSGFAILWGQLLSVTTFTLTFFVNQSYALWRKCSELSRSLQGRLHDMDMTLAAHATRMPSKNVGEPSKYTAESKQILEVVSRYVRLFNLLTYASFTRSHRPVLTPRGMRRLVERGLMTPLEREVLINGKLPATQRHNAVLLWILRTFIEGTKAGHFTGGAGFEQQFIEKAHVCRSAYGSIGDELQGRMPLAYAHIVQVLVDLVLALYPFMAYSAGMSGFVCVIGTGLLTIGYQGLADLAKQFLDPYDNENYGKGEDPLVVDTLIAETNAGSTRWMDGLAEMPVASQSIIDGELSEYILPRRGYTVEELQLMLEEQKIQKMKREKEELERQKKKEQEELEKTWAEAMIPGLIDNNHKESFISDRSNYIILDGANEKVEIPNMLLKSSVSMAEMVNTLTFSQNSNATSLQEALVPEGTVPIISFNVKKKSNLIVHDKDLTEVMKSDQAIVDSLTYNTEIDHHATATPTITEQVIDIPETLLKATVLFEKDQTTSNAIDKPVVTTSIVSSTEINAPNTIEYYQQKIQEILNARKEEDIRLTREIVVAPYGDKIIDDDERDEVTDNNLIPNDDEDDAYVIECEPTYEYLTIEEILEAEKQEQWETQAILNARPGADSIAVLEEEVDLLHMASNSTDDSLECIIVPKKTPLRHNVTESSVLVDIDIEQQTTGIFVPTGTIDDVMVELLETEAILNAPPGANSINVRAETVQDAIALNITDDLAVLEMDDPDTDAIDHDPMAGIIPDLAIPESDIIDNVLINPVELLETTAVLFVDENDSSRLERR